VSTRQGHAVFQFNTDESENQRRLGGKTPIRRRHVRNDRVWRRTDFKAVLNGLARLERRMQTLQWQAVDGSLNSMS